MMSRVRPSLGSVGSMVSIVSLALLGARTAEAQEIPVRGLVELRIENAKPYANPFADVELEATFERPDGSEVAFFGFHDGDGEGGQTGSVWKLRFSPDVAGEWRYAYSWSDGTAGGSGSFEAVASDLPGPIRADAEKPRLWRVTGRGRVIPFYVAGPEYSEVEDPRLTAELDFLKESLGANGVAIVLRNPVWLDCENEIDCSPGSDRFSIRNWGRIDRLFEELQARELGANVMFYTDDAGRPRFAGQSETERLLLRYAVARLAPYPLVTFDSGIDIREYRSEAWNRWFAGTLNALDPWGHPVGSRHGGGSGETSCDVCNYDSRGDVHPSYSTILAAMQSTDRPVFYTDRWREDFRRGDFDSDSLRRITWHCALAGGAGFMVGGQAGSLRLADFESDLDNPAQFRTFASFWHERLVAWPSFEICNDLVSDGVCLGDRIGRFVIYLESGGSTTVDLSAATGPLGVEWLNPRTGDIDVGAAVPGGGATELVAPDSNDWVLVVGASLLDETPPGAPAELLAEGLGDSEVELTWSEAFDPDSGISAYRVYRDGVHVSTVGAPLRRHVDGDLEEQTAYDYEVSALNASGIEGPRSESVTIETLPDETPPAIESIGAAGDPHRVRVRFTETVESDSAEEAANYDIDRSVEVLDAALEADDRTVALTTTELADDVTYTLTVERVRDRSVARNAIAANATAQFTFRSRVRDGLVVLYDFAEGDGTVVRDVSDEDPALDLELASSGAAEWTPRGLAVTANTIVRSRVAATKITDACRASGEVSIEAWITPANTTQTGPSRIVTLSENPSLRNFTLGQAATSYDARLRTTQTSDNGVPSISTPSGDVRTEPTHVVYTRTASGTAKLYVDGVERASDVRAGALSSWNRTYRLALANELSLDRPWQGELHLVAVYDRALESSEVDRNFRAGFEAPDTSSRRFRRGDANADGEDDISDAVMILSHEFLGAPVVCCKALDVDDSGALDVTDPILFLEHLFLGGPAPEPPGRSCGPDPTADELECAAFPPCG